MPGNKWISASETNFWKKHHKKPRKSAECARKIIFREQPVLLLRPQA